MFFALISVLAVAIAVGCGVFFIRGVASGAPWAMELVHALTMLDSGARMDAGLLHREPPAAADTPPVDEDHEERIAA